MRDFHDSKMVLMFHGLKHIINSTFSFKCKKKKQSRKQRKKLMGEGRRKERREGKGDKMETSQLF